MRTVALIGIACAIVSTAMHARADEQRPAQAAGAAKDPPPALVPPSPLSPLVSPYPYGAHGDAEVVLELSIDKAGGVTSARVVSGDEPFAGAAVAASQGFRFAPATRAGAPVAARIRAAIRFHEELAETPPEAAHATPTSAAAGAPTGAAPQTPVQSRPVEPLEVNVRGQLPPSTVSLTRAEVRLLPGAFGDPFRAIESMPGVTPIASGVPYFYVRGAPPGNVGYFLDGIRVPILFHLGLGPSVIHPALVDRVDLYEGGYPAAFGRFAGAIVSGETKPPAAELRGEANIRLVDAGAIVEAPFDDGRATALVGGRYGYTTLLLKLIAPDVDLQYWDYQARASYAVDSRDVVSAFAFGSYDHWGNKQSDGKFETLFDTQFHRLDMRLDHALEGGGSLRQAVTLGIDRTGLGEGRSVLDYMIAARNDVVRPVSDDLTFRFGADFIFDSIASDLARPGDSGTQGSFDAIFPPRDDMSVGLRGDAVIQAGKRLEITPGVRVDLYGEQNHALLSGQAKTDSALGVDPRISTRLALTKDVRLVQADGIASQPPSFFLPGPGLQPSLAGGLQRALQWSGGVEVDLPYDITASATLFRDAFFDMTDPLGSSFGVANHLPNDFAARTDGQATGLELNVKRKLTKRLGGFFAYTLSRSTRWTGKLEYPSSFDRTHVLNAAGVYDFGKGYNAGARVMFYTGAPATPSSHPTTQELEEPGRLPPFFRLDVRFEKRWSVGKRAWISFVVEVLNATFTKETIGVSCTGPGNDPNATCKDETIGPVTIPSIGVEGGF